MTIFQMEQHRLVPIEAVIIIENFNNVNIS